jgi:hypothetical protein
MGASVLALQSSWLGLGQRFVYAWHIVMQKILHASMGGLFMRERLCFLA